MSQKMRVAMGQLLVKAGQPQANLDRAVEMIGQAAQAGADLIVLPECLDIGWTDQRARTLAQPIPGAHVERLAAAARQHGLYVAAGVVERAGDRLYNTAVLLDADGQQVLLHRKINELDIAMDLYTIGDRLGVVHTPFGVIGMDICADNIPDSLAIGHVLARMGAQILVAPSAWAVPPDHDQAADPYGALWLNAYQQLSRLYDLPIIGVSGVGRLENGPWAGWKMIGCSLAVGADGAVIAQLPYGEDAENLTVIEIALRQPIASGTALLDDLRRRGYRGH
jgi:predicted amidohydrolase